MRGVALLPVLLGLLLPISALGGARDVTFETLYATGGSAPGSGGASLTTLARTRLTPDGGLAFSASFEPGDPGDHGSWWVSPSGDVEWIAPGVFPPPLPGEPGFVVGFDPVRQEDGATLLQGQVIDGDSRGVLYRAPLGGALEPLLQTGDRLPGGPDLDLSGFGYDARHLRATFGSDEQSRTGIWSIGSQLEPLLVPGDTLAGHPGLVVESAQPASTNPYEPSFLATARLSGTGVDESNDSALLERVAGGFRILAREGEVAGLGEIGSVARVPGGETWLRAGAGLWSLGPGGPTPVYEELDGAIGRFALGQSGKSAVFGAPEGSGSGGSGFNAGFSFPPGSGFLPDPLTPLSIDPLPDLGLYVSADGEDITLLATEGDPVPGLDPSLTFLLLSFALPVVDADDNVWFTPFVGPEDGNVFDTLALVLAPDGKPLVTVVAPGSLIEVATGDEREVESLRFRFQGPPIVRGGIPVHVDFTDGTSALLLARAPEPALLGVFALLAAAGLSARGRSSARARKL